MRKTASDEGVLHPHLRSSDSWELCDPVDCKHFADTNDLQRHAIYIICGLGVLLLGFAVMAALRHGSFEVRCALIAKVAIMVAAMASTLWLAAKLPK